MDSDGYGCRNQASLNSADLLDGLLRVSQIVRFRLNDWLGRYELTDGRHAVLTVLARAGENGCSQAELADQLYQSESNVSTLIERMQRDGLVSRSRSDADRRKRVLQITSMGRSTLASVDASRTAWAGRLMNGIPADDAPRLLALLQRLGASLEPSFALSPVGVAAPKTAFNERVMTASDPGIDPADDPQSPQFALRRMLLALSSSGGNKSHEKDVA